MQKTFYNVKFRRSKQWNDDESYFNLSYKQMYRLTKRVKGRKMKVEKCLIVEEKLLFNKHGT